MTDQNGYAGKDLEAMSFALNYHRWILSTFEPFLGTRIVEVGAGTGSFSELLLDHTFQSLSLIEPSMEMYQKLCQHVKGVNSSAAVNAYNDIFENLAERIREDERPDSIIYVNVLEHIADDVNELKIVYETLDPGGRVFIFVPAFQWLYGSFDRQIKHFRRYTRSGLETKCTAVGFRVTISRYFDLLGIVPWWVKYRLLKSNTMEPGAVQFYDQRVVPITKALESVMTPPLGKNVLLIAEKVA